MTVPVPGASGTAFSATSSTTLSFTKPTGLAVGDTLLVQIYYAAALTATPSLPSGWAIPTNGQIAWQSSSFVGSYVAYKVATSGDVAASSFTFDTTGSAPLGSAGVIRRITGAGTTSPLDIAANQRGTSGTTGTFPSVTTTGADRLVLISAYLFYSTAPSGTQWDNAAPSGTTLSTRADDASGNYFGTAYFTAATAGATGAKTVPVTTLSTSIDFQAITVAIAPAAGTTFNQSVSITVTPAPVLVRSAGKVQRVASTPVPTLGRASAKLRLVASTPSLTLSRSTTKALPTTSTPGLVLTAIKVALVNIQATTTPVPKITRSIARSVLIAAQGAARISRSLSKSVGVATTPGPTLTRSTTKTLRVSAQGLASLAAGISGTVYQVTIQAVANFVASLVVARALFWTPVVPNPETWTAQAATDETWTPVAPNLEPWTPQ